MKRLKKKTKQTDLKIFYFIYFINFIQHLLFLRNTHTQMTQKDKVGTNDVMKFDHKLGVPCPVPTELGESFVLNDTTSFVVKFNKQKTCVQK